jgi:hypothetical protein
VEVDLKGRRITDDELRGFATRATSCDTDQVRLVHTYPIGGGYSAIIDSISEAGVKPRYIFCPVGSGELLVALAEAAKARWPEDTPLIIGATIPENATLTRRFLRRLRPHVADKLCDPVAIYREHIKSLVGERRVLIANLIEEREIIKVHRMLMELGIMNEPSAAAAFVAALNFDQFSEHGFKSDDTVVIVNTGKGIYDEKLVKNYGWRRLKQAARYTAISLVSAALAVSISWGLIAQQMKYDRLVRTQFETRAMLYADMSDAKGRRDYWIDEDEAVRMCHTIPRKKCEAGPHPVVHNVLDFTLEELAFYVEREKYEAMNDHTGREGVRIIEYAYEHGRFRVHGGKAIWWRYDDAMGQWYTYGDGSERIYESSGDQCDRLKGPSVVCLPK